MTSPIHCLRMLRPVKKASVPAADRALMGDGERSTQRSSLDMMRGMCSHLRRVLGSGVASSEGEHGGFQGTNMLADVCLLSTFTRSYTKWAMMTRCVSHQKWDFFLFACVFLTSDYEVKEVTLFDTADSFVQSQGQEERGDLRPSA